MPTALTPAQDATLTAAVQKLVHAPADVRAGFLLANKLRVELDGFLDESIAARTVQQTRLDELAAQVLEGERTRDASTERLLEKIAALEAAGAAPHEHHALRDQVNALQTELAKAREEMARKDHEIERAGTELLEIRDLVGSLCFILGTGGTPGAALSAVRLLGDGCVQKANTLRKLKERMGAFLHTATATVEVDALLEQVIARCVNAEVHHRQVLEELKPFREKAAAASLNTTLGLPSAEQPAFGSTAYQDSAIVRVVLKALDLFDTPEARQDIPQRLQNLLVAQRKWQLAAEGFKLDENATIDDFYKAVIKGINDSHTAIEKKTMERLFEYPLADGPNGQPPVMPYEMVDAFVKQYVEPARALLARHHDSGDEHVTQKQLADVFAPVAADLAKFEQRLQKIEKYLPGLDNKGVGSEDVVARPAQRNDGRAGKETLLGGAPSPRTPIAVLQVLEAVREVRSAATDTRTPRERYRALLVHFDDICTGVFFERSKLFNREYSNDLSLLVPRSEVLDCLYEIFKDFDYKDMTAGEAEGNLEELDELLDAFEAQLKARA